MASIEIFNNRTHALLGDDFFEVPYNGRPDSAAGPPVPHAFSQFCGEASREVLASLDPFKTWQLQDSGIQQTGSLQTWVISNHSKLLVLSSL